MKRDESRDVFVLTKNGIPEMSESCISTWKGAVLDDTPDDEGFDETHYIPFSQLETEREVMRDVKREAEEIIAGLRAELSRIGLARQEKAREELHHVDTDGPHVLCGAWLEYSCHLCGETLCDSDGDPIDGLRHGLNGAAVTCECGAEYVGSIPGTASLYLLRDEEKEEP